MSLLQKISTLPLNKLNIFIGSNKVIKIPKVKSLDLTRWSMEEGDAPILSAIYSSVNPKRHLEFGTWEGYGACLCLKNSNATVWTINLFEGETLKNGQWAYGGPLKPNQKIPSNSVIQNYFDQTGKSIIFLRSDAKGSIGHLYRDQNYGHRVNQIYCDSRKWHLKNYPSNFFDTVLIDGGHKKSVVISDTRKALKVLRPGGIILWHDFCPHANVRSQNPHVDEVCNAIEEMLPMLKIHLAKFAWIKPSWLLVGIKK